MYTLGCIGFWSPRGTHCGRAKLRSLNGSVYRPTDQRVQVYTLFTGSRVLLLKALFQYYILLYLYILSSFLFIRSIFYGRQNDCFLCHRISPLGPRKEYLWFSEPEWRQSILIKATVESNQYTLILTCQFLPGTTYTETSVYNLVNWRRLCCV